MSDKKNTAQSADDANAKKPIDPKSKTIIVIEDEPMILKAYCEILELAGFNVLDAMDGDLGLKKVEENKGKIDLMILDLMMPGVDGLMVLEAIKKDKDKYGEVPVVVLTNLSSDRVIKEAFARGAIGYIMKTELLPEKLVDEIKKFLK